MGWKRPANVSAWKWCEENLELSMRMTAYPGKYKTDRTPYVREIFDNYCDPYIRTITLCWSAQSSKTMTLLGLLAQTIENAPGNSMFVLPSEKPMAQSLSETRLQPLIEDIPVLAQHKLKSRDKFKKLEMQLDNMIITLVGASSPANLASRAVKNLFLDEVDKYPPSNGKEADPISLAIERTKTYRDYKVLITSTPTVEFGQIWQWFLKGDQRYFNIPCPHSECGESFVIKWKMIKYDKEETNIDKLRESVYLECPCCGRRIEEKHKFEMLLGGKWVPTNTEAPSTHRSYHLSEMYSPWTRWADLVEKFVKAEEKAKSGDLGELQNFINSSLAEFWDPQQNSKRDVNMLKRLEAEHVRGTVPITENGIVGLSAGIDTQDIGYYYVIRAWEGGAEGRSYLVQAGYCIDDAQLERVVCNGVFKDALGREYQVNSGCMDTQGHRTAEAYDFCRKWGFIKPIKGEQVLAARSWQTSHLDYYPDGSKMPGGLMLYRLSTKFFKDLITWKWNVAPGDPGSFMFHQGMEEDYYKQLTAEYVNEKGIWECPKHKDNHLFDCEVYSYAAYTIDEYAVYPPLYDDKKESEEDLYINPAEPVAPMERTSAQGMKA